MHNTPHTCHITTQNTHQTQQPTYSTLSLLHQQIRHLNTLKTSYSQLHQEVTRTRELNQQKRQLQLNKHTIATHTAAQTTASSKLLIDKQNQCAQKEQQLKNIKQELISKAMSTTAISKENQALKEHILQLEQQYQSIKTCNISKRKGLNQLQTQIQDTTAELAHHRKAQLQYKKQLAQIRLDNSQHSHASIVRQIHQQHSLTKQFCAFGEQFCSV